MTPLRRIAAIGNSLPRRCGIATFTTDLQQAVANARAGGRNLHRRDERPRSGLRLSIVSAFSDQRGHTRRLYACGRLPQSRTVRRRRACSMNSASSVANPVTISWRYCRA